MSCKRLDKKKKELREASQKKAHDIKGKEIDDLINSENSELDIKQASDRTEQNYTDDRRPSLGKAMLKRRFSDLGNKDQNENAIGNKSMPHVIKQPISNSATQPDDQNTMASIGQILFSRYSEPTTVQTALDQLKIEIMDCYYQRYNIDGMVSSVTNTILINNNKLGQNSFSPNKRLSKKSGSLLSRLTLLKKFFVTSRFFPIHFFNTFKIHDIFNLLSMLRVVDVSTRNLICKIFQILMIKGTNWEKNAEMCEFICFTEEFETSSSHHDRHVYGRKEVLETHSLKNILLLSLHNELTYYLEKGRNFRHIDVLLDLCAYVISQNCFEKEIDADKNRYCDDSAECDPENVNRNMGRNRPAHDFKKVNRIDKKRSGSTDKRSDHIHSGCYGPDDSRARPRRKNAKKIETKHSHRRNRPPKGGWVYEEKENRDSNGIKYENRHSTLRNTQKETNKMQPKCNTTASYDYPNEISEEDAESSFNMPRNNRYTLKNTLEFFVENFLCKLLTKSNAFLFSESVTNLYRNTCFISSYYTEKIFDYFFEIFESSNTPVRKLIMEITFKILADGFKTLRDYTKHVCFYLNIAFKEQNCILINLTQYLLMNPLRYQLKLNIHNILPRIFNNLFILHKKYWNKLENGHISKMIYTFMEMDRPLFDNCLYQYNRMEYDQYIQSKISGPMDLDIPDNFENKESFLDGQRRKSFFDYEIEEHKRIRRNDSSND